MSAPNETYARVQSLRINNLEQQVQLIQGELQRLRDGVLQKKDVEKLFNLKERLKELNAMLIELRIYYNSTQQNNDKRQQIVVDEANPVAKNKAEEIHNYLENTAADSSSLEVAQTNKCFARENAGFDQAAPFREAPEKEFSVGTAAEIQNETVRSNDPFKTCKQLMEEIKPPGSILGNYLTKLQDFRADPELRRQRWERKQQEKLQQLQTKNHIKPPSREDKATSTEPTDAESSNYLVSPLQCTAFENIDLQLTNRTSESSASSEYIETDSNPSLRVPIISKSLTKTVEKCIKNADKKSIVLTLVLENDLYHLCIAHISDGQQLACYLVTEEAVQEAKQQHLFQDFLTFFVVNAENSKTQKDRVLGHLFEFIKIDSQ